MLVSPRRRLATTLIAGAGLLAAASPAVAAPVASGSFGWSSVNNFGPSSTPTLNRTWFGFVTNPSPQGGANGTVTPVAPTFGPALDGTSPRGETAGVRYSMPAVSGGTYDPLTRTGEIQFDGELQYGSTSQGFAYSLVDPRIVLDGANSKLYATGVRTPTAGNPATTFDQTNAVFTLDLSAATFTATQIKNIAPALATADWAFPSNPSYGVGAGPTRTPNLFGTFDVTVGPAVSVTPATDLDPAGSTVTVSGEGFKTAGQGLYVFWGPQGGTFGTDSTGGVKYVSASGGTAASTAKLQTDGSFSTTFSMTAKGGSGSAAFDCAQVQCVVRTIAAHTDADPSQRTATPVAFTPAAVEPEPTATATAEPTVVPTTTPTTTPVATATATPTATPPATPAETTPKLTKVKLAAKKLSFRVSEASTVTARVQRRVAKRVRKNGKVRRVYSWKTVRTIERETTKAGTFSVNPKLGEGRFRVTLHAVGATGVKGKAVRVTRKVG